MNVRVVTGPKSFGVSISVIPPGVYDGIEFQRCKIAIVLFNETLKINFTGKK
jgi:hypothetical protein